LSAFLVCSSSALRLAISSSSSSGTGISSRTHQT
jgi:hypothetical protein